MQGIKKIYLYRVLKTLTLHFTPNSHFLLHEQLDVHLFIVEVYVMKESTLEQIRRSQGRVARCFLAQYTKKGENIPNDHSIYLMALKYTKWG
jgi:hypothetical protein